MGDSDDEYDRRRGRDKFRRERSDYNDRRRERDERPSRRDDWSDRRRDQSWDNRRRGDYRDFDRGRRDSSGRQMSPPGKRMRRDWDDPYHGGGGGEYMPYGVPHHGAWAAHGEGQQMQMGHQDTRQQRAEADQHQAPAMMTFKQFLNAQDDNIDDTEAVQKYKEYKLEFRKTQTSDFFQQHKDEEWFKVKYHPKDSAARQKELQKAMRKRLAVFLELINSERAENVALDTDHIEAIMKFLDAFVIKLEGGTDNDLAILDRPSTPMAERPRKSSTTAVVSPNQEDQDSSNGQVANSKRGKEKSVPQEASAKAGTVPEVAPVSLSSVPLPDAPPPPSASSSKKASEAKAKTKDQSTVKPISMLEPTPEQQQLQQQAQYYYQQQLYQQQQQQEYYARLQEQQQLADQSSQAAQSTAEPESTKKEDVVKKKRKRRHREPYYYDAMDDESESESESDSEPEPAPPGEETPMEASSGQGELLPPGVEAEAPSTEEENLLPPGVDSPALADASIQLPSSSSATAAASSDSISKESKPDSGEQAVGSSEPEPEPSNVVSEGSAASHGQESLPDQPHTSSADSTQDADTKVSQPTGSCQSQAESTSEEKLPDQTADQPMDQVGSTDNAVITVKKDENNDMVTASSSEAEVKPKVVAAVEEEPPSQSAPEQSKPAEDAAVEEVAKAAEVDSNKLSEKKEVQEPKSPLLAPAKNNKERQLEEKEEDTIQGATKGEDQEMKDVTVVEPRALHKTLSLFLKSVPPNISKEDVTVVCKRFPGFLRVAFSDPNPERKFTRRGWITFDRSVNIKDISWDLNNTRIKDIEVNPVVNRDLNRRVRTVSGITVAKQIVRDDLKMAAKMIRELDSRMKLYEKKPKEETEANEGKEKEKEASAEKAEEGEEAEVKQPEEKEPDLPNVNPMLVSLSEDAAEEEGGEEMELIGPSTTTQPDESEEKSTVDLSPDENLMRVLDRLLLYLRVVHSLDYYNGGDYPYEDEMPNRCGIVHVRGSLPEKATQAEVEEWQKNLKQKLEPHIHPKESLPEEEIVQLGKKDPVAETEKFVEANTQELAKDKWLCPLSGKKFRGPEFVKKHIFNKHADKVDAVRMEAEFFNNYLSDPKRPQVPDPSTTKLPGNPSQMGGQMYGGHPHGGQGMMGWGAPRPPMMMYGRGHYNTPPGYGGYGHDTYGRGHTFPPKPRRFGFQSGRGKMSDRGFHREARQLVQYRDLDAPEDVDVF